MIGISKEMLALVDRLVNDGLVERSNSTLALTKKGRTEVVLRWRGLGDDLKVLIALWLTEQFKQGET